ncbi:hypothetical protein KDAU_35450 [Dictyobacter aurantiacus]|uniref:Uncharacterized protein n=1 Tax=Dictyobacter aurantiacus TaxID=1936993 RepID=A0A401ZHA3_9CHLR|nr:hypothetical protein KDAU_35450 [Dictyobacter aurantiacus]
MGPLAAAPNGTVLHYPTFIAGRHRLWYYKRENNKEQVPPGQSKARIEEGLYKND